MAKDPRESYLAMVTEGNALSIVSLLGALLMVAGVCLAWVNADIAANLPNHLESYTGWQIWTNDAFAGASFNFAGVVVLVAGVVAFIAALLPGIVDNENMDRVLGILPVVLGAAALILMVLFNGGISSITIPDVGVASTGTGIGFWISLIGCILLILGCILDISGKRVEEAEEAQA